MKTPIHLPSPSARWRLTLVAHGHDPLVVARALQKAAVPEVELEAVAYVRAQAHLELTLVCSEARAELTREKLERLADVRCAALAAAPIP